MLLDTSCLRPTLANILYTGIRFVSGPPSPSEFGTHYIGKNYDIQGEAEDPSWTMISWATLGLFWAVLGRPWAVWRLRRPSWGLPPGRCSPEVRKGSRRSPAGAPRRPRSARRPGGLRMRQGGGGGEEGGGRARGTPNLVNWAPPPAQFSKHVFGFSKLGFVLDSSQPANLVNCALCLENYFLNSAVPPPSPPDPPPGRLRSLRGPLEVSRAFWGPLGTSRGLCGPRGSTCPAVAFKTASAGAKRPKGALVRPRRAPRWPKMNMINPLGSSALPWNDFLNRKPFLLN